MPVVFTRGAQQRGYRIAAQQLSRDGTEPMQCPGQRRQVRVEDGIGQHRLQIVTLPSDGAGDMQRDLAADFAEQQLLGSELGQQAVADHSADADRPQARGEAEKEDRRGDPSLCGADAQPHSLNDAAEQVGIGVELLHRTPVAIDRPGPDREILVDCREFRQDGRGIGHRCAQT